VGVGKVMAMGKAMEMGMVWWKRLRSLLRRKFNVPTSHEQESRLGVAFISFSFLYIYSFFLLLFMCAT